MATYMRFFISHHQHKGVPYEEALKKEGWYFRRRRVDIALFDHTINRSRPELGRGLVNQYYSEGATIITYPHGATGAWWMDSDRYPPNLKIFANLVIGEGHVNIEKIIRPYLRHYATGWTFCPILDFQKPRDLKKILFAPIHASMHRDKLSKKRRDANSRVFKKLLDISDKYKITVRHLNPLETIGLWKDSRVKFKFGKPDGSYRDIDESDLVIAEGTFMYISVARGKPTIGFEQKEPFCGSSEMEDFELKHWNQYKDYIAYPIDFEDASLSELIDRAMEEEQTEWKNLFIGKEMNSADLAELLISLKREDIRNKKYS